MVLPSSPILAAQVCYWNFVTEIIDACWRIFWPGWCLLEWQPHLKLSHSLQWHHCLFYFSFEICDEEGIGNLTMCPVCDYYCDYWKLHDSCFLSKVTYLFDNDSTVFFSIFMSFWGKFFSLASVKAKGTFISYWWEWLGGEHNLICKIRAIDMFKRHESQLCICYSCWLNLLV